MSQKGFPSTFLNLALLPLLYNRRQKSGASHWPFFWSRSTIRCTSPSSMVKGKWGTYNGLFWILRYCDGGCFTNLPCPGRSILCERCKESFRRRHKHCAQIVYPHNLSSVNQNLYLNSALNSGFPVSNDHVICSCSWNHWKHSWSDPKSVSSHCFVDGKGLVLAFPVMTKLTHSSCK